MFTFVRSFYAMPGKLPALIEALKAAVAAGELGPSVAMSVGGSLSEVSLIWQSATIEQSHAAVAKVMADPKWPAIIEKLASCTVPNTAYERIYRHI